MGQASRRQRLPHLIAFTICGTADDLADESRQEVIRFATSGFRDFTRIAASDQVMWRAVRWGDAAYIEDKVERGRKIRRSLIEVTQAQRRERCRPGWNPTAADGFRFAQPIATGKARGRLQSP